jgi:Protein of unknown function (Ytp1)
MMWLFGGTLGLFLSSRKGRAQRNIMPAFVFFLTGWALTAHPQAMEYSRSVHEICGHTMMAAGVTRIVESVIISHRELTDEIHPFQHVYPFVYLL